MQWFKGTQKIKEGAKFAVKYIEAGNNEYDIMLEIAVSSSINASLSAPLKLGRMQAARHVGKAILPLLKVPTQEAPQLYFSNVYKNFHPKCKCVLLLFAVNYLTSNKQSSFGYTSNKVFLYAVYFMLS